MIRYEGSVMKASSDTLKHLWFPFTYYNDLEHSPPLIIEYGRGLYVYDKSGKGYLDAIGSWWVSILGHNHPEISEAIKKQLDKLEHVMMAGFVTEPAIELADKLISILPRGLNRIFYSDNGSTAVEVALKIALQYQALKGSQRSGFIAFSGAYHGDTLGAMSVGMIPHYHATFHARFKMQSFVNSPYCYRCPTGKESTTCKAECMDSLEQALADHGDTTAACIFEPMVQGAGGMRIYPEKVLKRVFALCRKYDVLTIADEVAMGFGRTGKMFACEHARETPDIMCLAKGITGGYLPLAATAVKEHIFDEFKGGFASDRIFHHGHTFTGNPLAAAAACATLDVLKREKIPESLKSKVDYFQKNLQHFNEFDIVGDIRSIGMIGALELVRDRQTKEPPPPESRLAYRICRKAIGLGLLLRPLGNVVYFVPPYIISEDEINNMFHIAKIAMHEALHETDATL
ncbi:MAG: adenosylmethionine--8-amino-7-oxononanoate transaminase [Chitinivibrionales bacterium]|nr:adenosylmethionine--8-amino-7-oxononanoate transaminase [Chitinivibrionales bacterium]